MSHGSRDRRTDDDAFAGVTGTLLDTAVNEPLRCSREIERNLEGHCNGTAGCAQQRVHAHGDVRKHFEFRLRCQWRVSPRRSFVLRHDCRHAGGRCIVDPTDIQVRSGHGGPANANSDPACERSLDNHRRHSCCTVANDCHCHVCVRKCVERHIGKHIRVAKHSNSCRSRCGHGRLGWRWDNCRRSCCRPDDLPHVRRERHVESEYDSALMPREHCVRRVAKDWSNRASRHQESSRTCL
ncbi:hypothetical protein DFJ73DRAFT_368577 [Zopfochytrium polystomum]|nr:hypothetical protein DFJ73DRAFT_368577 [Zopfochytrium polystomum]